MADKKLAAQAAAGLAITADVLSVLSLSAGLIEKFLKRNDVSNLFSRIKRDLRQDADIPEESRKSLASSIDGLKDDSDYLGGLRAFLDDGDLDVLGPLAVRAKEIYELKEEDFGISAEEIGTKLSALIEQHAVEAKQDDRRAAHLDAQITRSTVTNASQAILDRVGQPPKLLSTSSTPEAISNAVVKLIKEAPKEYELVEHLLDVPSGGEQAAAIISNPDARYGEASPAVWVVLARLAERSGRWGDSAPAWARVAAKRDDQARALMNASIACDIAGDTEGAERYFEQAKAKDPDCPKVVLELAERHDNGEAQLDALDGLVFEDEQDQALLQCHRSLAYLRIANVGAAQRTINDVPEARRSMMQVRMVRATVEVERNRYLAREGRKRDVKVLRELEKDCLEVRDELLVQARWGETLRLLMLAADAAMMRDDREQATAILNLATDEEIGWHDGPAVLGDAAIRVHAWTFGLRATADPQTLDARRIRASCLLAIADSAEARTELEDIIELDDGYNSKAAAAMLLVHSALRRRDWSATAEGYLVEHEPESEWLPLKAFYLAQEGQVAEAIMLLDPFSDQSWALHALMQISTKAGDLVDEGLARRCLGSNPEQWLRAEAARVLVRAGHPAEAEAHARAVAEDENTPTVQRSAGYDVLLEALVAEDRLDDAGKAVEAWAGLDPTEETLNFWVVRVGNRLAHRE